MGVEGEGACQRRLLEFPLVLQLCFGDQAEIGGEKDEVLEGGRLAGIYDGPGTGQEVEVLVLVK